MKVSELKADLDAFSSDVNAKFEAVDRRFEEVDRRFEAVDRRFDAVDARFDAMDRRFDAMDARFDALRHEVREEIAGEAAATRAHFDEQIAREGANTRRHFDVVAESMKADVAVFMARMTTLDQRVAAVRSEQTTQQAALSNHEVRLQALERPRG